MNNSRKYTWADGKIMELGQRTLVMGILNVTPDSFSDGGQWNSVDRALRHMEEMVAQGADIIDVGAESSRPGFQAMTAEEELERLTPFLEALVKNCPVPVSLDTFKAATARRGAELGVHILNDIWGLQYGQEPGQMAAVAAEFKLPVVVMHNRVQADYQYDILLEMKDFFHRSIAIAKQAGIDREKLILDPGIGFGQTPTGNLQVLRRLEELNIIDGATYPLLLGVSRKSFIGHALGLPLEERLEATGAACVLGIMKGAAIVRVHDVRPIVRMCRMADAILQS